MLHRVFIFISALGLALSGPVRADFRVPYQDFQYPYEHGADYSEGRGYFRPEYAEMVQRLSPETMQWVIRNYPVLGWREMDPRPFTPKPVPGDGQAGGFSYDTARRNMELESLFHFGPVPGNGTLIAELIRLDKHRVLTVNEGSRNLSVLDLEKPDVEAVIRMPWGLAALEMNLPARELYLVERGRTAGLLVYDLETYQVSDTMLVDFHPGAVLLSGDTRSLYMTDEQAGALLCWDLTGDEPAQRVMTGLEGPCLLAADSRTGTIILVSRSSGDIRLYRPRSLDPAASRMSLGGTLVAFHAPEGADRLYLASGSGTSSSVFSLSLVGRG
ncbi:MAG: hypothetical protein U9P14_07925, partial [Gemmatimonadota bacterium]|nr:hypothetical protein [Gemmatimonadota bacterium]